MLIYKYWLIKKRLHPGSLLRRYQVLDTTDTKFSLGPREAYQKFIRLRQDFEKARLLLDLVRKRELLKREHVRSLSEIFETQMGEQIQEVDPDKLRRQMQTAKARQVKQQQARLRAKTKAKGKFTLQALKMKKIRNSTPLTRQKNGMKTKLISPTSSINNRLRRELENGKSKVLPVSIRKKYSSIKSRR